MSKLKAALMLSLALLSACNHKSVDEALDQAQKDNAYSQQNCEARIPATSSVTRVADPVEPSACVAVVMMCNYCEYDSDGMFKKSGRDACGLCLAWDAP
jgi:hypothetical protein